MESQDRVLAFDEERRAKLKGFLVEARSRLKPHVVGLPSTTRCRVIGLRREEIAELVGVSNDWPLVRNRPPDSRLPRTSAKPVASAALT